MGLVLPVLVPLDPGVGGSEDEAGDDDVEGEFAPEFCGARGLLVSVFIMSGDVGKSLCSDAKLGFSVGGCGSCEE